MQKTNHPKPDTHQLFEKHPKQDFQVERIAFFSDAVFAIAITLLIIDFHPPHITKESTYNDVWREVVEMKYKLGALIVSFVLIISFWRRHHFLFKHVHDYNTRTIMANMFILLPIIFFPFTTSFLYESLNGNETALLIPFRLFLINNILAGILMYYFYWLIAKKYKQLSYPMTREEQAEFVKNLLLFSGTFLVVFALSFISFGKSLWGLLPIALYRFYTRRFKKNKTTPNHHVKQTGGSGH
ncbi:MAG TPA: TMEM175 family protein [Chitinophagaceae bacterium]|jgi:uncharacterized membrane protein